MESGRYRLKDAKLSKTPMATTSNLDKDEQGINVDIKLYRSMIGSLLYLTVSRSDIMFNVCLCARFQSCPIKSRLIAVKRIISILRALLEWACSIRKSDNFQ